RSAGDSGRATASTRAFSGQSSRQDFGGRGDTSRSIDRGTQQRLSNAQGMSRRFEGTGSRSGLATSQRANTSRRPSFQEASSFLGVRGDGSSGRIGEMSRRGNMNLSGRGDFMTSSRGQEFRSRVDQSRSQGDRAWSNRFGGGGDRRVADGTRVGAGSDISRRD